MPVVRTPRRRFNLGQWLITLPILLAAVAGIGGLAVGLCTMIGPGEGFLGGILNDVAGVDTADLPGDARAFDPFAAVPAVAAYAGDGAELVEIDVRLVRADGTMDLKASYSPKPDVTYRFAREVERPANAPPPGAGGANIGPWYETINIRAYEPGQRRRRTTIGGSTNTTVTYTNKGMERDVQDPRSGAVETLPTPRCSIEAMFAEAIREGAPADAVANVSYDADGYEFSISGIGIDFEYGHDCERID